MKRSHYTLNNLGQPVTEPNLKKWALWFESSERRVSRDTITSNGQSCEVSTVFLGIDHSWLGGPPVLWETMVFSGSGPLASEQDRCCGNREQAEAMHKRMCDKVIEALKELPKVTDTKPPQ